MEADELMSMFPSLTRATVDKALRDHRGNEDAVVSALMEAQERQGGVGGRGESSRNLAPPSPPPKVTVSPVQARKAKVAVACKDNGRTPLYFDAFWAKHGSEFAPLSKSDAEKSLFFDKHFAETSEEEGKEEIVNVLRKLKRRSLQ